LFAPFHGVGIVYELIERSLALPQSKRISTESPLSHVYRNVTLLQWEEERIRSQNADSDLAKRIQKETPNGKEKSAQNAAANKNGVKESAPTL
jgi:hypothetical protein